MICFVTVVSAKIWLDDNFEKYTILCFYIVVRILHKPSFLAVSFVMSWADTRIIQLAEIYIKDSPDVRDKYVLHNKSDG